MKILVVVSVGHLVPKCCLDEDVILTAALRNGHSECHPFTPGEVPKAEGIELTAEGHMAEPERCMGQNCSCPCPPHHGECTNGPGHRSNFWSKDAFTLLTDPRELFVHVHCILIFILFRHLKRKVKIFK